MKIDPTGLFAAGIAIGWCFGYWVGFGNGSSGLSIRTDSALSLEDFR